MANSNLNQIAVQNHYLKKLDQNYHFFANHSSYILQKKTILFLLNNTWKIVLFSLYNQKAVIGNFVSAKIGNVKSAVIGKIVSAV